MLPTFKSGKEESMSDVSKIGSNLCFGPELKPCGTVIVHEAAPEHLFVAAPDFEYSVKTLREIADWVDKFTAAGKNQ